MSDGYYVDHYPEPEPEWELPETLVRCVSCGRFTPEGNAYYYIKNDDPYDDASGAYCPRCEGSVGNV